MAAEVGAMVRLFGPHKEGGGAVGSSLAVGLDFHRRTRAMDASTANDVTRSFEEARMAEKQPSK